MGNDPIEISGVVIEQFAEYRDSDVNRKDEEIVLAPPPKMNKFTRADMKELYRSLERIDLGPPRQPLSARASEKVKSLQRMYGEKRKSRKAKDRWFGSRGPSAATTGTVGLGLSLAVGTGTDGTAATSSSAAAAAAFATSSSSTFQLPDPSLTTTITTSDTTTNLNPNPNPIHRNTNPFSKFGQKLKMQFMSKGHH